LIAIIILLFADLVKLIAMPALAGLHIVVGFSDHQARRHPNRLAHRDGSTSGLADYLRGHPDHAAAIRRDHGLGNLNFALHFPAG